MLRYNALFPCQISQCHYSNSRIAERKRHTFEYGLSKRFKKLSRLLIKGYRMVSSGRLLLSNGVWSPFRSPVRQSISNACHIYHSPLINVCVSLIVKMGYFSFTYFLTACPYRTNNSYLSSVRPRSIVSMVTCVTLMYVYPVTLPFPIVKRCPIRVSQFIHIVVFHSLLCLSLSFFVFLLLSNILTQDPYYFPIKRALMLLGNFTDRLMDIKGITRVYGNVFNSFLFHVAIIAPLSQSCQY